MNDVNGHIRLDKGTCTADETRRIARHQALLASLSDKAVSAGTLANPKRLPSFLAAGLR